MPPIKRKIPKFVKYSGGVIVVFLVTIACIILISHLTKPKPKIATNVCSTQPEENQISNIPTLIKFSNATQFNKTAQNILTLQNYQKDPNCLFVLTMYYSEKGDITNAQKTLTEFNQIYKNQSLNNNLVAYESVSELRQYVSATQKQAQQSESISRGLSYDPNAVKK